MSDELHYYVISEDEYQDYAQTIVASKKKYTFEEFKTLLKQVDSDVKKGKEKAHELNYPLGYFKNPQTSMMDIIQELCDNHGFIEVEPLVECHTEISTYHESELDFTEL